MHTPEQQATFIVLRANGWSFAKISDKLKIPKSTASAKLHVNGSDIRNSGKAWNIKNGTP